MSGVKRYDPINSDGTCGICVEDADYGAYVEYSDYAALDAECERMRQSLTKIHDRCEAFVGDDSGMQVHSVEVLMGIAARVLGSSL